MTGKEETMNSILYKRWSRDLFLVPGDTLEVTLNVPEISMSQSRLFAGRCPKAMDSTTYFKDIHGIHCRITNTQSAALGKRYAYQAIPIYFIVNREGENRLSGNRLPRRGGAAQTAGAGGAGSPGVIIDNHPSYT